MDISGCSFSICRSVLIFPQMAFLSAVFFAVFFVSSEMEIITFLNQAGIKDNGKPWTIPKIKDKIMKKYGGSNKGALRYDGFLRWILGGEMGMVLQLKLKFEKLATDAKKPVRSKPQKLWKNIVEALSYT